MKVEYYVIIAVLVFVVVFGSILLYLLVNNNKKKDDNPSNSQPSTGTYKNYQESSPSTSKEYTEANSKKQTAIEVFNDELFRKNKLTIEEMTNVPVLRTVLKFNKQSNLIELSENASQMIFTLYGNLHTSYKNEIFIYDNMGSLIVKLNLYPETNKITINDWHETENVFAPSEPWPKTLSVSVNQHLIRLNNIIIYEYPQPFEYKTYHYIKINTRGIKDIQMLSINQQNITAEDIIKK